MIDTANEQSAAPADRCPFSRPFREDFDDCAVYQPQRYVAFDTHYDPLKAVWTCAHLAVGTLEGRRYARCGLGTAGQRAAHLEKVQAGSVVHLQAMARESAQRMGELSRALFQAKAVQLQAAHDPAADAAAATSELWAAAERFIAAQTELLQSWRGQLEDLGLPPDAVVDLMRSQLEEFVNRPSPENRWVPPAELIARIPPHHRVLFRGLAAE